MLKATLLLSLAAAASAKAHGHCEMCPSGKTMVTSPKTVKTKACLAVDELVEPECYTCMKKAFSRTYYEFPECLNCNYTNGTEVFCPDIGMGYPGCGISASTTCVNASGGDTTVGRVTRRDDCVKKTEAEKYSWCAEVMGDPWCEKDPTGSFQCDEGQPVKSSSSSWAKCPRLEDKTVKDPECAGCLNQYKGAYERKVESCYKCFKTSTDNNPAWCPNNEKCDSANNLTCTGKVTGNFSGDFSTCPNSQDKKYNTTGVPGFVPEATYGYCADVMGEPWCQKNPTESFQCDEGEPVIGNSSKPFDQKCPDINYKSLWAPATLVKNEQECTVGPGKMEDVTCDEIQKKIDSWKGTDCKMTELFERFGAKCCVSTQEKAPSPSPKKNVTGTGGVANTVSHTVLAAAGFVAFLV